MQSFREPAVLSPLDLPKSLPLAVDITICLTTVPLLSLLLLERTLASALSDLGEASEELFRGDRLPILPLLES